VEALDAKKPFYAFEAWGIECGDGWNGLLDDLCSRIEDILEETPELKKDFKICQIKEKFGGLRFYVYGASEKICNTIDLFQELSYNICERCGNNGNCRKIDGWIYTLCDKCCSEIL
jgi:hypothetical protein